ncbi:hypothetical protein B6D52_02475 [Candidatus Parcubacteria bacterium 4484_255]|nr:MAG: hypothetical protein B6D52_02475 [Candidatus Parcubacteria bacterium 4484_255]
MWDFLTRFLGSIINMTKFFDLAETLIASELWNKLSGEEETMEQILAEWFLFSEIELLEKDS